MDRGNFSKNDLLDVVVRFHDSKRIAELSRCLFSLVCQTYRPIAINLCTQRFSPEDVATVQAELAPLLDIDRSVHLRVHNFASEHPADARSSLLNLGITRSAGRYLAFLDYDDVIFPESYQTLVRELLSTKTAIAFGAINVKHTNVNNDLTITTGKSSPFSGENLRDLFRANCCPIHSFIIDRSMVSEDDLYFDNTLARAEDYDLLMRICASYPSSFRLRRFVVGDYYYKDDGSNTVITHDSPDEESKRAWEHSEAFLAARRDIIVVSPAVQRSLGISKPNPKLTIRMLVDAVDSGRLPLAGH